MQWKWTIWYSDGTKYSNKDGGPEDAPALNVQVITIACKRHGWRTICGDDYYIWERGRWWGANEPRFYQYLFEPGWKKALFGQMLEDDEWDKVFCRAYHDPDLPPKTAFSKGERRPVDGCCKHYPTNL